MQIVEINTYLLKAPTEKAFYSSQGLFTGRKSLIVEIKTDTGLVGWGEGGQYGPAEPTRACIESVFAPQLIGSDPLTPPLHWERLYSTIRDFGTSGPYIEALSALDIAMWDIAGKHYGTSIANLIGGARRKAIYAYGTGFYYPADAAFKVDEGQIRDECARKLETGFGMMKVKIGLLSIAEDARRLKIVRDTVGDDIQLLVDCNHSYNFASARKMAEVLDDYGVLWFEEPVIPEDKDAYRKLRDVSPVPIAGGEAEYTRHGFKQLILGGCVDIAQPDVCVAGGISEWMRIQALASVAGVSVIPHIWGSGIALAAALQVLAATPANPFTANPIPLLNEPVLEFDTTDNPLRTELLVQPFGLQEGFVQLPEAPGLGISIDEGALRKYSVTS
ncbi:mandelate racemase/muconate lactonizing enzyme family protein [Pseudarthrobacter oxydans]|uniref:mandelate racemase/muconate lactonizing enzyme family protein n=1 Tax=Pseudarthrobacter oxydans TaxID=1671 RepID=UPI00341EB4AB